MRTASKPAKKSSPKKQKPIVDDKIPAIGDAALKRIVSRGKAPYCNRDATVVRSLKDHHDDDKQVNWHWLMLLEMYRIIGKYIMNHLGEGFISHANVLALVREHSRRASHTTHGDIIKRLLKSPLLHKTHVEGIYYLGLYSHSIKAREWEDRKKLEMASTLSRRKAYDYCRLELQSSLTSFENTHKENNVSPKQEHRGEARADALPAGHFKRGERVEAPDPTPKKPPTALQSANQGGATAKKRFVDRRSRHAVRRKSDPVTDGPRDDSPVDLNRPHRKAAFHGIASVSLGDKDTDDFVARRLSRMAGSSGVDRDRVGPVAYAKPCKGPDEPVRRPQSNPPRDFKAYLAEQMAVIKKKEAQREAERAEL